MVEGVGKTNKTVNSSMSDREKIYYDKLLNKIKNKDYRSIETDVFLLVIADDKKKVKDFEVSSIKTLANSKLVQNLKKLDNEQIAGLILHLNNTKTGSYIAPKIFGAVIQVIPNRATFISEKLGSQKSEIQQAWMELDHKEIMQDVAARWIENNKDPIVIAKNIVDRHNEEDGISVGYAADSLYMLYKFDNMMGEETMRVITSLDRRFGEQIYGRMVELMKKDLNLTSSI